MFAGYTHRQAILLAEKLLDILPKGLTKIFYSDNGSTAVECAIKMAFQIKGAGHTLLSFDNAYHGDTFGAMAAAGKTVFNQPFWPYLFRVVSIPAPVQGDEERTWNIFRHTIETTKLAAFIFEPLIQGVGGMVPHSPVILKKMITLCKERGILTIADEVMTGFGRTGPLFAMEVIGETPDIICLAKGLTGGFLPLAATAVKEEIYAQFLSEDPSKAFLHGHTYTANPIACAAANASLELLLQEECTGSREIIHHEHLAFKKSIAGSDHIARCDVVGTILAIEYKCGRSSYFYPRKQKLIDFFQSKGIFIRPFGNVLHVIPPYCISQKQLHIIYRAIIESLEEI